MSDRKIVAAAYIIIHSECWITLALTTLESCSHTANGLSRATSQPSSPPIMDKEDKSAMRVLLLKNYPSASPSDFLFIDSFLKNIQRSRPEASLDVCCVANGETIPALSEYGLVVLSGGRINLLEDAKPLWVLQVLDMIRALASEKGGPKLLGICWGHQAVHYALGGKLDWLEVRPRVCLILPTQSAKTREGK